MYGKILALLGGPAQALNVWVEFLAFYEAGPDGVPRESRLYGPSFPQQYTRYIMFDMHVIIERWEPTRLYELVVRYYRADGRLLQERRRDFVWPSKFRGYWLTHGCGWASPGQWELGEYEVQFLLDGVEIAKSGFTIKLAPPPPPSPPPPETLDQPRVRFYASRREPDSVRFPYQTTREVLCELTVHKTPYQQQDRSYSVTVQCYTVEGMLQWGDKRNWLITAHKQEHSISWELPTSGWSPGIYRVEILIDGKEFAWGAFAITPAHPSPSEQPLQAQVRNWALEKGS